MAASSALEDRLGQRLEEAVARHALPGAVLAVSAGDETAVATTGVANLRTGVPVTRDTVFPIGSVTKIYQTALMLSLGLDLDDPVRRHLPEFRVADADATDTITLRHLVTHASGMPADYVPDFGRGDDAVRLFVESCASLEQLHPPGLLASYCNTGFVVSGRLVEVAVGSCWEDAFRERLLAPAGLEDTVTLPEEAILRPVAVGHVPGPGGLAVTSAWSWPRAFGPPGGTPAASAPDLLRFGRLHLEGAAPLGSEIPQAMAEFQRPWPEGVEPRLEGVGLGWMLSDWDGTRVLRHGGSGVGCYASLNVVPDRDAVVVCLTNAWWTGYATADELVRGVLEDELGLVSLERTPTENPHPPDRYVGTYTRTNADVDVVERPGGRLALIERADTIDVLPGEVSEREVEPLGEDLFHGPHPRVGLDARVRFLDTDGDGMCDYVYDGLRAHRRVEHAA